MSLKKKCLIVAHRFPPINSIASKRWAEMIPELEKEFDVYVFTQGSEGDLPIPLEETKIKRVGFIQNLHFKNTVYKRSLKHKMISFFTEKMRTIDSTIFSWYWNYRKDFENFAKEVKPDVVITTINPFSTALFGYQIKRKNKNIKWIVDIRDSVSLYNRSQKNYFQNLIDTFIDKYIVKKADVLFTVSQTLSDILSKFYKKEVKTIYNGFNFYNSGAENKDEKKKIQLYYAGKVYEHREVAFKLLLDALYEHREVNFEIRLLGDSLQVERYNQFLTENNMDNVEIKPPAEHQVILQEEHQADILVLLEDMSKENEVSKGTLTGKLFEYLCNSNPILAICRDDSEIGVILQDTQKGKICTSTLEISDFIQKSSYYQGVPEKIEQYSRQAQAVEVKKYIKEVLLK